MNRKTGGFTLIELLVVIVILGILMALLLPAIQGSIRTAKDAACTAEINSLGQALEAFKTKYGDYPPSRVVLNETLGFSAYPASDARTLDDPSIAWRSADRPYRGPATLPNAVAAGGDITFGELAARLARYLKKFFPRAAAPDLNNPVPAERGYHDFDGSNVPEPGWILLEGDECLAFFLGGLPSRSGTGLVGFAKDPKYPFKSDSTNVNPQFPSMTAVNRESPHFEFKADRLLDRDGDGMPGYLDPLNAGADTAREYAYFSAHGSGGYDPNDMNRPEEDPRMKGGKPLSRPFRVGVRPFVDSPGPNPYTATLPLPLSGNCPDPNSPAPTAWEKAQSYQILSAGKDGVYGVGGRRDAASGSTEPLPIPDGACPSLDLNPGIRDHERDNLANFANRRLGS